jgi:hypothetical protein
MALHARYLHATGNEWTVHTTHAKTPPRKLYSLEAARTSPVIETIVPLTQRQGKFL